MNERESGSTENASTETKLKIEPVRSLPDYEPEYRVQVLLPGILQTYPKHVVHAVLAEHGLSIKSLAANIELSSDPWSKTHWKQCYIPLPHTKIVRSQECVSLSVSLNFRTSRSDPFIFSIQEIN